MSRRQRRWRRGGRRSDRDLSVQSSRLRATSTSFAGLPPRLSSFLRPSELLGLERRDVDLDAGLLHVRGTKTARSQRSVPMPRRARQALAELPARVDTRLVFPAPAGGRYELNNFRPREFAWAVAAAGLPESVTPYTLRHSGLSWALAAGIPAIDIARFGGTSVTMLERVYHHLLVSSAESARARMDEFLSANTAVESRGLGVE